MYCLIIIGSDTSGRVAAAARRSGRVSTIVFRDTICLTPASAAGDRLPSRKLLPPDPYRLARRVSPYVSRGTPDAMIVAGVSVRDQDVLDLVQRLLEAGFEDTADALAVALDAGQRLVAVTVQDREAILRVLEEPPDELAELRGVLLREHARVRDGLV